MVETIGQTDPEVAAAAVATKAGVKVRVVAGNAIAPPPPVAAVITIIGGVPQPGSAWPPCRVPGRTSVAAALKRRKKIEKLTNSRK